MSNEHALASHDLINQRSLLLGFLGLNALAGLSVGVAKVILSLYAIALEADATQLGLIAGAQSVGILLMSLPAGVLVDQYGPLRLFTIGTLCSGALYLLMPLVDSAALLCLTILLISCFMPLRIVSLSAMFMQQIGRVGVGMAGWFRATHMVGMLLLGPMAAAWLLDSVGFAGSYLTIGATFFLLVLLAPGILRRYQRPSQHVRTLSLDELKAQVALLRHDLLLRHACLREFCIQGANQFFSFFIVVIAIQSFHFEHAAAAGLISAQGTSYVLALLGMGSLAWRMDEQSFSRCACLVIAGALFALGLSSSAWGLWGGAIALGLGLGMLQIVNITWFAKAGERRGQGRIAGLTTFVGPAGGLAGSVLGGALGHWLGLQSVFFVLIPVFIAFLAGRAADARAHIH
ncbi:MFS transporter [Pseudomonas sp. LRF_L74]|uniref:MFS transporter n=1 Tax=Pseudomonas sp. LRF_L74 TaxID=3369422 RepID=UPI003F61B112